MSVHRTDCVKCGTRIYHSSEMVGCEFVEYDEGFVYYDKQSNHYIVSDDQWGYLIASCGNLEQSRLFLKEAVYHSESERGA